MGWEIGLAIAGAMLSAVGTFVSAQDQADMSEYNAAVAQQNAELATQKAAYDEKLHNQEVRRFLASQRALYGKSGVVADEGSPLLVMDETVKKGAMDALAIRYGGQLESLRAKSAANLYNMQADNIRTAGAISAGTSLLSSGAKIFSMM